MASKRKAKDTPSLGIVENMNRAVRKGTRTQTEAAIARKPRRDFSSQPKAPSRKRLKITMDTLQPADASKSSFLALPREVRDRIYHELWDAGPHIKQRWKKKYYSVTYGNTNLGIETRLPYSKHTWLLANKRIMHEGIQQLHQDSVWHFDSNYVNEKSEYIFPLLAPSTARVLHLYIRCCMPLTVHHWGDPTAMHRETVTLLNRMISMETTSDVREIHVTFLFAWGGLSRRSRTRRDEMVATVDFSELERLSAHENLRSFVVNVITESNLTEELSTATGRDMKREIRRIGERLVAGGMESDEVIGRSVRYGPIEPQRYTSIGHSALCWRYRIEKTRAQCIALN